MSSRSSRRAFLKGGAIGAAAVGLPAASNAQISLVTETGYVVVDAVYGDDETARRDSRRNRFASLSKAFAQIRDNDLVLVYPGQYVETPEDPTDLIFCGATARP